MMMMGEKKGILSIKTHFNTPYYQGGKQVNRFT